MSKRFAFVPANELGKPSSADRKIIRSHCMQGKNRRERLPPSAKPIPGTSVLFCQPSHLLSNPSTHNGADNEGQSLPNPPQSHQPAASVALPQPLPPDIALVSLAERVDRQSQELLFQCQPFFKSSYPKCC